MKGDNRASSSSISISKCSCIVGWSSSAIHDAGKLVAAWASGNRGLSSGNWELKVPRPPSTRVGVSQNLELIVNFGQLSKFPTFWTPRKAGNCHLRLRLPLASGDSGERFHKLGPRKSEVGLCNPLPRRNSASSPRHHLRQLVNWYTNKQRAEDRESGLGNGFIFKGSRSSSTVGFLGM